MHFSFFIIGLITRNGNYRAKTPLVIPDNFDIYFFLSKDTWPGM